MKAKEMPHHCPVCGELYVPDTDSVAVPGTGPLTVRTEECCIKAGESWCRAYYHGDRGGAA